MFRLAICWGWTETAIGTQAGSGSIARSKERDSRIIDRVSDYRERGREYGPEAAAGRAPARGAQTCRGTTAQAEGGTQS